REYDSASVIAVCEGETLAGLVTIERLLAADPTAAIRDIMDTSPPVVNPQTHQERVAWLAFQHGEPGLAVVDEHARFRGLVPAQSLLAVLLAEHDEDMARLGGFLSSASSARSASTEPVAHRLAHRIPWILIGLLGALFSAGLVGSFESVLEEQVLVAFFVPGVVYIADAVGTQTETLVIRGLSLGVEIRRVVARELLTGLMLGLLLALVTYPTVQLIWHDPDIALTVAVAMFAACSTATVVAMALPWLIQRLGKDPAFGSGPLATVVQDLLTVVIYFAAASVIAV
ncbi:MAG: magnesium transporter, partial [Nocardioidaceae bacterium]